ncbi:MAG TPA: anti-sigma factor antagonist [Trebonia sp.]|jgi:anti-anti-sigma factor
MLYGPGDPVLRLDIIRDDTAGATVQLAGEIDTTSVDAVRRAVADLVAGARRIVLDLSRVTFCDAAGARFLVEARRRAGEAGTDLIVRNSQPSVIRVLELTGALPLLCPDQAGAGVLAAPAVVSACEAAVFEAIRVSGADKGNAQLVDPATGALRIVAQRGFERPFLEFFETVHGEESACGTALVAATPVWVTDVARSPIFAGTPALVVMLGAGARAVASVPVCAPDGGDVLAMISVHCGKPTVWTERRREQLAAVAAVTGRVLSGTVI